MRKTIVILIVLALLGLSGVWAYQRFVATTDQPAQEREEAVVKRGSLTTLVNATGTVLPQRQTTLSFRGVGQVAEVLVEIGETVSAGQVLARLDTTEAEFAVRQAELALASAQTQLLRLQRPAAASDIAAAQAALQSAQAAYDKLLAGPSAEEIRVARANLDQAQAARDQAQRAYDLVANRPDVGMLPQALQLQQATIAYDAAKASYELAMRKPSAAELAAAQSAIAQAEANLARLQQGASEEDLLAARLQVEQAQLSLEQARHQLESATLTAPHTGTITLVGVKEGELTGSQPAFVVTDLSVYHIDVSVDEIDIGQVTVGQPVTITLDALPGTVLSGRVDRISDTSQLDAGVVVFKVTIGLAPTDAPLRVGMTASVDILTERRDGVLLVPNRFVRIDRTTGQTFVERLVGGQVQPVEIQTGARDESHSEVLAGLSEGDVLVLVKQSSREQLRSAFQMGRP